MCQDRLYKSPNIDFVRQAVYTEPVGVMLSEITRMNPNGTDLDVAILTEHGEMKRKADSRLIGVTYEFDGEVRTGFCIVFTATVDDPSTLYVCGRERYAKINLAEASVNDLKSITRDLWQEAGVFKYNPDDNLEIDCMFPAID